MDNLRNIVDNAAFPVSKFSGLPVSECFAYSRNYLTYETNKVFLSAILLYSATTAGIVRFMITKVKSYPTVNMIYHQHCGLIPLDSALRVCVRSKLGYVIVRFIIINLKSYPTSNII